MASSIFSRKRDLLYLTFFLIHIPILFIVDLVPLYPKPLQLPPLLRLRALYVATYRDRFFTHPPAWFSLYAWMELLYHVPLSFWTVGALLRDDPMVPVQLLVFAVQVGITTVTCIADFLSWKGFKGDEKLALAQLYVPYLALAVFMGVDMYGRLERRMVAREFTKKRN